MTIVRLFIRQIDYLAFMKALVVYYSRSGHTAQLAEALSEAYHADIEKINDYKSRKGFFGWFKSGYDALTGVTIPVAPLEHNLKDYNTVIIGTPVWVGTLSTPVLSFIQKNIAELQNKKLIFFATHGAKTSGDLFEKMLLTVGKKPIDTLSLQSSKANKTSVTEVAQKSAKITEELAPVFIRS